MWTGSCAYMHALHSGGYRVGWSMGALDSPLKIFSVYTKIEVL